MHTDTDLCVSVCVLCTYVQTERGCVREGETAQRTERTPDFQRHAIVPDSAPTTGRSQVAVLSSQKIDRHAIVLADFALIDRLRARLTEIHRNVFADVLSEARVSSQVCGL